MKAKSLAMPELSTIFPDFNGIKDFPLQILKIFKNFIDEKLKKNEKIRFSKITIVSNNEVEVK